MGVIDRSVGRGVTRKYDDDNRAKKLYKNVWAQSLKSLKKVSIFIHWSPWYFAPQNVLFSKIKASFPRPFGPRSLKITIFAPKLKCDNFVK